MLYIIFSVFCSVIVSVILKLLPRWQIDVKQAITGNYLVAGSLAFLLLSPQPQQLFETSNSNAWLILLALAVLLPSIFLALARSVASVGIIKTDAAQRLSLILPLLAAFTLFGEQLNWLKGLGIALGLLAISFIVIRPNKEEQGTAGSLFWPLSVFIGFGAIDILFKKMAQIAHIPFTTVLFGTFALAFLLSGIYMAFEFYRQNSQWQNKNILAALILGLFNFGNIYSYLLAHRKLHQDPALVFSSMNIGVIALAAVIGLVLFKERLSRLNFVGIALAILAVAILTLSRSHAG